MLKAVIISDLRVASMCVQLVTFFQDYTSEKAPSEG